MADAPTKGRAWTTARLGYLVALVVYLAFHIGLRLYHGDPVSRLQTIGTAILTLCAVFLVATRVREARQGRA